MSTAKFLCSSNRNQVDPKAVFVRSMTSGQLKKIAAEFRRQGLQKCAEAAIELLCEQ